MGQGTPCSSQLIWAETRIEKLEMQLEAALQREQSLRNEIRFAKEVVATQRYGVAWEGDPKRPTHKQMPDGYWMPWHMADLFLAGFLDPEFEEKPMK